MVLTGIARKSALVAAIFVAIGWILVIAGFGSEIQNQLLPWGPDSSVRFPWWMVVLATPVFLISAITHAIIDRSKLFTSIMAVVNTILGALFLTALGHLLNIYGQILNGDLVLRFGVSSTHPAFGLQFSGSIIASVSWVVLACLSYLYENQDES